MKLISMTDYVLEQSKIGMEVQSIMAQHQNRANRFDKIVNYANFLRLPLRLGHFIPCDENDVPLEKLHFFEYGRDYVIKTRSENEVLLFDKYQQACDRVLFEGCVIKDGSVINEKAQLSLPTTSLQIFTIESLINLYQPLTLTESLIKTYNL